MNGGIVKLKELIGSADRIGMILLPSIIVGLVLNILYPSFFQAGGPGLALQIFSIVMLIPGIVVWLWTVALILSKAKKGELITNGPYRLVKHPLYTGVAFLVLPWVGFLLNSWLGLMIGTILYISSRIYSPGEERNLKKSFGSSWDEYCKHVIIKWM